MFSQLEFHSLKLDSQRDGGWIQNLNPSFFRLLEDAKVQFEMLSDVVWLVQPDSEAVGSFVWWRENIFFLVWDSHEWLNFFISNSDQVLTSERVCHCFIHQKTKHLTKFSFSVGGSYLKNFNQVRVKQKRNFDWCD